MMKPELLRPDVKLIRQRLTETIRTCVGNDITGVYSPLRNTGI